MNIGTVRSLFYFCWIAATIFSTSVYAIPMVTLYQSSPTAISGQSVKIDILVDHIDVTDQLLAFGFDLSLDPHLVLDSLSVNTSLFNDDTLFFPTTAAAGSAFPPVSGDDILLAWLYVTPNGAGSFNINLFSDFTDFGFSEGLFTESSIYNISSSYVLNATERIPTVPEPEMLSLFTVGLMLLGVRRRFKFR